MRLHLFAINYNRLTCKEQLIYYWESLYGLQDLMTVQKYFTNEINMGVESIGFSFIFPIADLQNPILVPSG